MIDIDDVISYLGCPIKVELDGTAPSSISSFEELKVLLFPHILNYYYGALGRNSKVLLRDMNKRLGYIWDKLKPKMIFSPTPAELISIHNRVEQISKSPNSWEVIGTSYKIELPYIKNPVKGTVNIVLRRGDTIEAIWYDDSLYPHLNKDDFLIKLKSLFIHNYLKRKARGHASLFNVRVYRLVDGYTYIVPVEDNMDLPGILKRIVPGISSELFYPRSSRTICRACKFRGVCKWSAV